MRWFKQKGVEEGYPGKFHEDFEERQREKIAHDRKNSEEKENEHQRFHLNLFSCNLMVRRVAKRTVPESI
jgi:hypothetical protein